MANDPFLREPGSRPSDSPRKPRYLRWGKCLRASAPKSIWDPVPKTKCDDPALKACNKCNRWKSRKTEFHLDKTRGDGHAPYCKVCAQIKSQFYRSTGGPGMRPEYIPCAPFTVRAENGRYVLCSVPMARRPHDEVHGYKRGYEPSNHPVWVKRVRRMLPVLDKGPLTAFELQEILEGSKLWAPHYTINVLIAAQELEMVAYDGVRWHAHTPGTPMPPMVEKPATGQPEPGDDVYPDQLPICALP